MPRKFILYIFMSLILALLPPLAIIMVPMLVILFFAYRLKYETPVVAAAGKKKITRYHVLVWSAVVIFYVALAMLLSTAWVRGDDWMFLNFSEGLGLKEKFTAAMGRYLAWVARGGEFYGTLLGVSFSRWENWLVTPIFAVAAPFAFFALVKIFRAPCNSAVRLRICVVFWRINAKLPCNSAV